MNDLTRIDWNLLPALDALLGERNVSRAARRTGVTQPAMSNALKRLRRHFGDDLLVRHGNMYRLTPLGERLGPMVGDLVRSGATLATSSTSFDPTSSTRQFTIAATEAMQATLAPSVAATITAAAPRSTIAFVSPFTEPFRTSDDILAGTDGWLAPSEMLPGRDHTGEWWDEWVCVVSRDHPTIGDAIELQDVGRHRWVMPTIRGVPISHWDVFAAHGIDATADVLTEGFLSVAFLVGGTERVGVMQRRPAERLAASAGVRVLPCPWPVQPLRVTFWWDSRWSTDPAHAWLRSVVAATMAEQDGPARDVPPTGAQPSR